ncbi:hypothetical protein LOD99_15426 [Oopsacas minuta]|uniref:Uncharacterized protein n=1 Tax=Oopsacas minuta TaxID=111878 RepID=A0AAV7KCN4_9METZ|nr:hypothetical protein LOD99_15426 [Oopsacas minuta]
MMRIICLLLISVVSVYTQNNIRILRDVIAPDDVRTANLFSMLGINASQSELEGIPYINSDIQWLVHLEETGIGFNPRFVLELFNTEESPHYQIIAIEIMSSIYDGACGLEEDDLAMISRLEVQIGYDDVFSDVNTTSYLTEGFLDMELLGLTDTNNYIRFRIPPMNGDEIRFVLEDTNPSFQAGSTNLCLQFEFIGLDLNAGTELPPGPLSLLQYNMQEPTFSYTMIDPYDDVMYNGAREMLYTGARGKLTDGIIGTDPDVVEEWVGFDDLAGLQLFFDEIYSVKEIRVYYWSDEVNGAAEPMGDARNRDGNRIMRFQFTTYVYDASVPQLMVYAGEADSPVDLDYVLLRLRTPEASVLISEVSVLREDAAGRLVDVSTGFTQSRISFVPEISADSATTMTSTNTRLPPSPQVTLISSAVIYGAIGIVSCLFLVIASMCIIFVIIFCVIRTRVKKEIIRIQVQHSPVRRKSSSRYEGLTLNGEGNYAEVENVYAQVDRTLPLPPIPGEETKSKQLVKDDSYIEMERSPSYKTNANGLKIDTRQTSKLVTMRTLSEDDYAPVTPPSASIDAKGPPKRVLSDPYVVVTPPPASNEFKLTGIEENQEPVDADRQNPSLAHGIPSISNEYTPMGTKDSPVM